MTGEAADAPLLVIGGRRFRFPDRVTYRQRLHMRRQVIAAGLHTVAGGADSTGALAQALVERVSTSGLQPELLAAWLVEDGQPWSEAGAERNAAFFGNVTDPEDMDVLDGALLPLLVSFFAGKPISPATSPSSSAAGESTDAAATQTSATPASAAPEPIAAA